MLSYHQALVAFVVLLSATAICLIAAGVQWFVRKLPLPTPLFVALLCSASCSGGVVGRIVAWWLIRAMEGGG